jgi:hypothetical protein
VVPARLSVLTSHRKRPAELDSVSFNASPGQYEAPSATTDPSLMRVTVMERSASVAGDRN